MYHIEIAYKTTWSALRKVVAKIFENWHISYLTRPQYLQFIKDSNPETMYKITGVNPHSDGSKLFTGVFWAFG